MNIEILFRGKDENGNWHEGSLFISKHGTAILVNKYENLDYSEIGFGRSWSFPRELFTEYQVKPETVGQLWIVNNVRLFGGDLFKATCSVSGSNEKSTKICKVVDSDQGFSVSVWHNGEWWAWSFMDFTTIKHIGNIHDNQNILTDAN